MTKKKENMPKEEDFFEEETVEETADNAEVEKLREEVVRLKDSYLRAHAEMDNLRKRSATEIEKREKYAVTGFAKDLLSVADSIERALASVPEDGQDRGDLFNSFIYGMEITLKELKMALARHKVMEIESVGKKFDPAFHQAIQTVEDKDKENGIIVAEWQKGYMIEDRVLREANVIVVKNAS